MTAGSNVVVTGLGVVSPIGIGRAAFWDAAIEGRSGVRAIPQLQQAHMPVSFGGELPDFNPKQYVKPRKSLKVMCREIQIGFSAAVLALSDAGLDRLAVDPDRLGVLLGSDLYFSELSDVEEVYRNCIVNGRFEYDRWGERFTSDIYPLWLLRYLPNMAACHIAIAHDARGPNNTLAAGDASSLLAISEAVSIIQRGQADLMLAGGTGGRLHPTSLICSADFQLSQRVDQPAKACRPFDAHRDGMVLGEGGAVLVLESRRHAEDRGADILAQVLGYGLSFDSDCQAPPEQRVGIRNSIRQALRSAGLRPEDIGHVNAHGLSDVEHDAAEAAAIRACLGETPVTAPKSLFGNLGAGGGAVEAAISILSFRAGQVPATLNYETADAACPLRVIRDRPLCGSRPTAMLLNQSRTGQAAAVVVAAP